MKHKIFYFDTETTGLNSKKHDIVQLAYIIEIDKQVKEEGSFYMQPFNYDTINQKALEINHLSVDKLKTFDTPQTVYKKLIKLLDKYVDKYNKNDKFSPAGYNVHFDVGFLNAFFKKNNNKYFGAYFDYHFLDPISTLYMLEYKGLIGLENLKLVTIAKYLGIELNAHEALSDIKATRQVISALLELYLPDAKEKK